MRDSVPMDINNKSKQVYRVHCPKYNLNLRIITSLVTAGADEAVQYVCLVSGPDLLYSISYVNKSRTYQYTVASASAVTSSVFMRKFRLLLA